jgi:hypothetical protein
MRYLEDLSNRRFEITTLHRQWTKFISSANTLAVAQLE